MESEIIVTEDGSHTIYIKQLDERYHSVHGAVQESKHVFIKSGLQYMLDKKSRLNILEVGLGTGLNALLTFMESGKLTDVKINYNALEAFPITPEIASQLNYLNLLEAADLKVVFDTLHSSEWQIPIALSDSFSLIKVNKTLQDAELNQSFDLIYFDAFAPRVQPELWTEQIFEKLYRSLNPQGCLVTYCAKGEVKRNLKKVGFVIEALQGPPGKREMIRAVKSN